MQAPIAVNGREIVDLSLRNSTREKLKDKVTILIENDEYIRLLRYAGKVPLSLSDFRRLEIKCKAKYRYTYGEGGHMVKHKDTISSPSHVGTLVIVEQQAEDGGHLVIDPQESDDHIYGGGTSRIIKGSRDTDIYHNILKDNQDYRCESVIIPLNVDHLVTKVEKGTRISRTYEIHIDDVEDMETEPIDVDTLDMSNIVSLVESRQWDKNLVKKYTKGNKFIVYPSNPDPIEQVILRMILDTHSVVRYVRGIVVERCDTEDGQRVYYNDQDCTVIGSLSNIIESSTEYNDSGYTTTCYYIANLIEIE